jgi:hypothetical protein
VTPLATINRRTAESAQPEVVARFGLAINWMPTLSVSERSKFLHDARAATVSAAIVAPDGQARAATLKVGKRLMGCFCLVSAQAE